MVLDCPVLRQSSVGQWANENVPSLGLAKDMGESSQETALSDSLHLPDARLLSLQELRAGAWVWSSHE